MTSKEDYRRMAGEALVSGHPKMSNLFRDMAELIERLEKVEESVDKAHTVIRRL